MFDPSPTADAGQESVLARVIQAVKDDVGNADAWVALVYLLMCHKKWGAARDALALAVQAVPDHAVLLAYRAIAQTKFGMLDQAHDDAAKAWALDPHRDETALAMIEVLSEQRRYEQALIYAQAWFDHHPCEAAVFAVGSLLFMQGEHQRGMSMIAPTIASGWRGPDLPEWDGRVDPTAHIVLYNGQGFGDFLMFARYIDDVVRRVGRVTLRISANLARLVRGSFPHIPISIEGDPYPADLTARRAIPSLAILAVNDFSFASERVPYLHADPDAVAVWHEKLKDIPRPHIGLAWSSPLNQNAPARALSFDALRPLVDNFKPHLISLQLGDEAIQAAQAGIACPAIGDFADNAALIKVLDLVITLDSAPAHLAAALGTPTWILLPFHAEWRWLTARDDTPWYPSVRLFRQTRPMAWDDVVARVCEQIKTIMD